MRKAASEITLELIRGLHIKDYAFAAVSRLIHSRLMEYAAMSLQTIKVCLEIGEVDYLQAIRLLQQIGFSEEDAEALVLSWEDLSGDDTSKQ